MLLAALVVPLVHAWAQFPEETSIVVVHSPDLDHHGYSHDDDWPQEIPAPHNHGHPPADHSHDTQGLDLAFDHATPEDTRITFNHFLPDRVQDLVYGLERPPRA